MSYAFRLFIESSSTFRIDFLSLLHITASHVNESLDYAILYFQWQQSLALYLLLKIKIRTNVFITGLISILFRNLLYVSRKKIAQLSQVAVFLAIWKDISRRSEL